jgi:hypothetical protein
MKTLLLSAFLFASGIISAVAGPAPVADTNLTMFGRGLYPGNDTTYTKLKESGFTTIILSSFYVKSNGDVYSGDDNKNPIIHDGQFVGSKEWLARVASLKKKPSSITRIEILLEGRWYNQPPNTFDFIQDWSDASKTIPGITTGTGKNSTLYKITKIMKEEIGVDAVCIDDESVYNSESMIKYGQLIHGLNIHMTLCPFRNSLYWKQVLDGSKKGLIDAVYLQCYDGGKRNTPGAWKDSLMTNVPVYPIMMCRGSFSSCNSSHGSKTADEIKAEIFRFKKTYPALKGGAIWQMADVNNYVKKGCAVEYPESGTATTVSQFLEQLKNSLKGGL